MDEVEWKVEYYADVAVLKLNGGVVCLIEDVSFIDTIIENVVGLENSLDEVEHGDEQYYPPIWENRK